ncbi:MAG: hypothetical protein MI922_17560 [Bacteroidales bacterium]|nr:hypothetical protein [Bacteroidales bacterium]
MAAAAVLLALVVWRLNKPVNVESLYSSFYQPYESDFITRDAEGEDNIQFGLLLYQDKEYENAYSIFENYLKENFNDQRIRFHAGLCALELEKYSNAVQLLEQVSADKNTIYQEHALWYLSLAYLKVEKLDEAYESLQIVANGNTLNKSKAEKLLSSSVFKKIN